MGEVGVLTLKSKIRMWSWYFFSLSSIVWLRSMCHIRYPLGSRMPCLVQSETKRSCEMILQPLAGNHITPVYRVADLFASVSILLMQWDSQYDLDNYLV